ncbi:hypothetical protein [Bradyrhizobium erythrophlei]|uniref:Uncharacterized protein n=1 Tax=Bradyrhizobium erythrophlei TaxID=1437360 RepID=A0A1M5PS66_9BRAD|nr:hypothetical protein [Bradyrhizobium erythrophlei]SHH04675.1 hypothetical protein SAMN05443248_3490 [Bradyrhizobium erythrophlei]
MDADRLYVSPSAAEKAGNKAIIEKRADGFRVKPSRKRNDDRSWDFGFVAVLIRGGQTVGFA